MITLPGFSSIIDGQMTVSKPVFWEKTRLFSAALKLCEVGGTAVTITLRVPIVLWAPLPYTDQVEEWKWPTPQVVSRNPVTMSVKIADVPKSFKCDMWNHFAFLMPRNEKREKGDRQSKTMCRHRRTRTNPTELFAHMMTIKAQSFNKNSFFPPKSLSFFF